MDLNTVLTSDQLFILNLSNKIRQDLQDPKRNLDSTTDMQMANQ